MSTTTEYVIKGFTQKASIVCHREQSISKALYIPSFASSGQIENCCQRSSMLVHLMFFVIMF